MLMIQVNDIDMVEAAQVLNRTQSLTPLYQNETGYLQIQRSKEYSYHC